MTTSQPWLTYADLFTFSEGETKLKTGKKSGKGGPSLLIISFFTVKKASSSCPTRLKDPIPTCFYLKMINCESATAAHRDPISPTQLFHYNLACRAEKKEKALIICKAQDLCPFTKIFPHFQVYSVST